jgi:hypothetical protein
MIQANIHNRLTVERFYSQDAFDRDSRLNAEIKTDTLRGVKIMSPPDANGNFRLARASHHVAELNPEGDVIFVFPHGYQGNDTLMQGSDYGGPEEKSDASVETRDSGTAYDQFISRLIKTAKSANFKPAIGLHEERLEGFHGG